MSTKGNVERRSCHVTMCQKPSKMPLQRSMSDSAINDWCADDARRLQNGKLYVVSWHALAAESIVGVVKVQPEFIWCKVVNSSALIPEVLLLQQHDTEVCICGIASLDRQERASLALYQCKEVDAEGVQNYLCKWQRSQDWYGTVFESRCCYIVEWKNLFGFTVMVTIPDDSVPLRCR